MDKVYSWSFYLRRPFGEQDSHSYIIGKWKILCYYARYLSRITNLWKPQYSESDRFLSSIQASLVAAQSCKRSRHHSPSSGGHQAGFGASKCKLWRQQQEQWSISMTDLWITYFTFQWEAAFPNGECGKTSMAESSRLTAWQSSILLYSPCSSNAPGVTLGTGKLLVQPDKFWSGVGGGVGGWPVSDCIHPRVATLILVTLHLTSKSYYGILAFTNSFVWFQKGRHVTLWLIAMFGFKVISCYEHYLPRTGNNSFVTSAIDAVANRPGGSFKISIPFLVLAQGF